MSLIVLTVRSENDKNVTSYSRAFNTDNMSAVRSNQNTVVATTITESGDSATQLSSWSITGAGNTTLYWVLINSGTTRTVYLYADQDHNQLVSQGSRTNDGAIILLERNGSGVNGGVTVAYTADDVDTGNTLVIVSEPQGSGLRLNGATEFIYRNFVTETATYKYTVDESVATIAGLIDKCGKETVASGAPTTVTYASAFADTSYVLIGRCRNAADDTEVGYAITTRTAAGFVITPASDGVFEWVAKHL